MRYPPQGHFLSDGLGSGVGFNLRPGSTGKTSGLSISLAFISLASVMNASSTFIEFFAEV